WIVESALHRCSDLRARRVGRAIEHGAIDAERVARKREHTAELAGADNAYAGSSHLRGSRRDARLRRADRDARALGAFARPGLDRACVRYPDTALRESRLPAELRSLRPTCQWPRSPRGCRAASARSTAGSPCRRATAISPAHR